MAFDIRTVLGAPFVYGGRDCRAGLDCYGLVMEFYRQEYGLELPEPVAYDASIAGQPHDASAWEVEGVWLERHGEPRHGDVLTFRQRGGDGSATHVGVLLRDGRVVQATEHGVGAVPLRAMKRLLRRAYRHVAVGSDT